MSIIRTASITPRRRDLLIILASIASHALYIGLARARLGVLGYPLDDAWIYQTYARNLAASGQWAFVPGVPSTGSTSILWTFLIAPAYLLHLNAFWWTQALGLLTLIGAALGAARLFEDDPPLTSMLIGLVVAMEWHLVWAAASGMETGLFAAMLIWYWVWVRRYDPALLSHRAPWGLVAGLIGGLLMLARPEGLLAFAAVLGYGAVVQGSWWRRLLWLVSALVGFAILFGPFITFNQATSGSWWPNTFTAKQIEYQYLWSRSFSLRFLDQLSMLFVGAQVLLIPGLIYELYRDIRYRSDAVSLVPWVWAILHLAAFAYRLPQTYQHGRYALPVIVLVLIHGIRGVLRLARPLAQEPLIRVASQVWLAALAILFPIWLVVLGAPAYARDVTVIEDEMVQAAEWINANTTTDTVIAAHDIGALGYFAPRPLVDLAGLVSPEIIPHMHDPEALSAFILARRAEYLIAFPNWSPAYTNMLSNPQFCPVWTSDDEDYDPDPGLGPLTIYRVAPVGGCPINSRVAPRRAHGMALE